MADTSWSPDRIDGTGMRLRKTTVGEAISETVSLVADVRELFSTGEINNVRAMKVVSGGYETTFYRPLAIAEPGRRTAPKVRVGKPRAKRTRRM